MIFTVSEEWRKAYPGAGAGILVMRNVANPDRHPKMDGLKDGLQRELRDRFAGNTVDALKALAPIRAYNSFYKRFDKSYHVLLQLESVALKGKPIASAGALVEAMFLAELKNLLLTAGHDLAAVKCAVKAGVATGTESFVRINGKEQLLKAGDMMMADDEGIISSVLYGPDLRTRIMPSTNDVLFTVYAPAGIEAAAVQSHLEDIKAFVTLVAPAAEVEMLRVFSLGECP